MRWQVAKIPDQLPPTDELSGWHSGAGKGGLPARLDAVAEWLARLEADLEAQFLEIEGGLSEMEATLAAAPALVATPEPPAADTVDGPLPQDTAAGGFVSAVASPYGAAFTPGVLQGRPGPGPELSARPLAVGGGPGQGPGGRLGPGRRAGAASSDPRRESGPGGAATALRPAPAAAPPGAVTASGALREDPERRLYLSGVQHHARGPVLMTVDLYDLRDDSEPALV